MRHLNQQTIQRSVIGLVSLFSAIVLSNQVGSQPIMVNATAENTVNQQDDNTSAKHTRDDDTPAKDNVQDEETSTNHAQDDDTSSEQTADNAATIATNGRYTGRANSVTEKSTDGHRFVPRSFMRTAAENFEIGNGLYPRVDTIDVSNWQSWMTQDSFNQLKAKGVKAAIVKLTEGTYYTSPSASNQLNYARSAGMNVAAYHFATFNSVASAEAEARNFVAAAQARGLGPATPMVADVEMNCVSGDYSAEFNAFWRVLSSFGYNNHIGYTSLYSQYNPALTASVGGSAKMWIAQYPYTPRANHLLNTNYGAWQFASTGFINGAGPLDVSIDHKGLFSAIYDKIQSQKSVDYEIQINQAGRTDGVYPSGPFNTSANTSMPNADGPKYAGQIGKAIAEATTPQSTYVQVRLKSGVTFWIDKGAVQSPVYDKIISTVPKNNVIVQIDQTNRADGIYTDAPYMVSYNSAAANSDGRQYNGQFAYLQAVVTTNRSTYGKIKLFDGSTCYIDTAALKEKALDQYTSVNHDQLYQITAGANGSAYSQGPYRTSVETSAPNKDAFKYNASYVQATEKATTLTGTYIHITLHQGLRLWINQDDLTPVKLDSFTPQAHKANYQILANSNAGIYAEGPYFTSKSTLYYNTDGNDYGNQFVTATEIAKTAHDTYIHVTTNADKSFWISKSALRAVKFDSYQKSSVRGSYQVEAGRWDGVFTEGPYMTSLDTAEYNTDGSKYNGQMVEATEQAVTARDTYLHVKTADGSSFWISQGALKQSAYDTCQISKANGYYTVDAGQWDGVFSAGPYMTSLATSVYNNNGPQYNGQVVQATEKAVTSRDTYLHVKTANDVDFWISKGALKATTFDTYHKSKTSGYYTITAGQWDGIFSAGPYMTDLATSVYNNNGPQYNGQVVQATEIGVTSRDTYVHVKTAGGQAFWISKGALSNLKFDTYKKTAVHGNYKINAGRWDGVFTAGPYMTSFATAAYNNDAQKYNGTQVKAIEQAITTRDTYIHVTIDNKTSFWISKGALIAL